MGFLFLTADCSRCRRVFAFNPLRVPSVVVAGERLPLCRDCVEWANAIRASRGLATWTVYPDSYEPVDEQEVPFS
jgi:hypothetical protein